MAPRAQIGDLAKPASRRPWSGLYPIARTALPLVMRIETPPVLSKDNCTHGTHANKQLSKSDQGRLALRRASGIARETKGRPQLALHPQYQSSGTRLAYRRAKPEPPAQVQKKETPLKRITAPISCLFWLTLCVALPTVAQDFSQRTIRFSHQVNKDHAISAGGCGGIAERAHPVHALSRGPEALFSIGSSPAPSTGERPIRTNFARVGPQAASRQGNAMREAQQWESGPVHPAA